MLKIRTTGAPSVAVFFFFSCRGFGKRKMTVDFVCVFFFSSVSERVLWQVGRRQVTGWCQSADLGRRVSDKQDTHPLPVVFLTETIARAYCLVFSGHVSWHTQGSFCAPQKLGSVCGLSLNVPSE